MHTTPSSRFATYPGVLLLCLTALVGGHIGRLPFSGLPGHHRGLSLHGGFRQFGHGQGHAFGQQNNYIYHGMYNGKCSKDGLYFKDTYSFIFCSNGNSYIQPCAPGSKNSGYSHFSQGGTYNYRDFCDVNLVDHGYGVRHYAGHQHANHAYNGLSHGHNGQQHAHVGLGHAHFGFGHKLHGSYGFGNKNIGYNQHQQGYKKQY